VVCYRLRDGEPVWINRLQTRFFEAVGGAGPRATPTYHEGRLYTTGANGAVQCLDAVTGDVVWRRELVQDTGAKVPQWAFSSSPLIAGEVVVVFAGGPEGKAVVAYSLGSGDVVWMAGEGSMSYSSPHLARFGDTELILMATENGLLAMDPRSGEILWRHDWPLPGMRVVQPAIVAADRILLAGAYGGGSRLLHVKHGGESWDVSEVWTSRYLDPYFNDFVVHHDCAYGFSGQVFCCIDLQSGRRLWKGGRYGYGQVLLLPAMDLLLIAAESGDVVLVAADPAEHRELGRFPAMAGKTWNHPVVANNFLLVRNDQEAACFELTRE
jgi:outer membrane protein assembly factor BamB